MPRFLLTGGAGFIGSNLVRFLLEKGNEIVVFDNFSTGKRENLQEIAYQIEVKEGDLRDLPAVTQSMQECDGVFHLGALGSVPRSIADPETTTQVNAMGTFNVLQAARQTGVKRIVFSGSSSAYGDQPVSPKVETMP
ncbi:MAG: GDP-mannose 4,6-dehydratase, partial [Planctomycetia bacterium]|nr:GDP-mannose 4,6-dehydratase [Planctomycetia bacterium]